MISIIWKRRDRYAHFARALQSRPFALLWAGQAISSLGDGAFTTALAWEVLLLTGSATAMSIVVIARYIPMLVFLLFGGVAADRLPRLRLMLYSDLGRAVIVLLVACLGWVHLLLFWHLIVLSLFFGFVSSFFNPAYNAIPTQLVDLENLSSANALKGLSRQMSTLLGPLLGAGCVALAGPAFAFAFDGLTFIISVFCLFSIRLPISLSMSPAAVVNREFPASAPYRPGLRKIHLVAIYLTGELEHDTSALASHQQGLRKIFREIQEGVGYIINTRWLLVSILIASITNIGIAAPLTVVFPKLVQVSYHAGVWTLGMLITVSALGSIAATLLIGQSRRLRRRGTLLYLALIICSTFLIVLGLPLPPNFVLFIAIVAEIMIGFGLDIFIILWETLLQEFVPGDKLGRVNSMDQLGSLCLLPVGYALAGVLADQIGPGWVLILGGSLNLVLAGIALSFRDIRHLE